ncbi:unnamed protein product [Tilletia controversa]|uniref:J domain-containing protein n=3 Tax=Tilletia TaxID=13289 RepID=A0A8X7MLX5_9BASI|nr:hypothetical protein CF336_g7501 [Tilletia laevis]KAE8186871.1 hypothetical protein CF328_g7098 [Tilletia controversa]KAE8248187.1 hypothetical protein A4X03_0g6849 [Tilletia caries]KAE8188809.1 hypothetical protein CF335_g6791 [Tilletia laevis]KAE8240352.1 hypothetical protein A4X06_0g7803 [Tilletia controversa]
MWSLLRAAADESNVLTPFIAWSVFPVIGTAVALRFAYSTRFIAQPKTPAQAADHQRYARALVVGAYLLYSLLGALVAVFHPEVPNHYALLGIAYDDDADAVKKSFRKLARQYHPDKLTDANRDTGEAYFLLVRKAHDTLVDPMTRFAYDRFGPSVLDWREPKTLREYMQHGFKESILFYVFNPLFHSVLIWIHGSRVDSYWRFCHPLATAAIEYYVLSRPVRPKLLANLFPLMTPREYVTILHHFYTALIMAFAQLGPLFPPRQYGPANAAEKQQLEEAALALSEGIKMLSRAAEAEAGGLLVKELEPFRASTKPSAKTLPEAAASAAAIHAASKSGKTTTSSESGPTALTNAQQTWIKLLADRIFYLRLEAAPVVREMVKVESAKSAERSRAAAKTSRSASSQAGGPQQDKAPASAVSANA